MCTLKVRFLCNECKYEWSIWHVYPRCCPECESKDIVRNGYITEDGVIYE